jgi:hypothetical protein
MVQKRVKKTFSMILERVFEMVWWRGRKWHHIKKELASPFIWRDSWSFSFSLVYMCSVSWELGGFDDIWFKNHFFKNFFSNGLTWNGMVMTMDIPTVDAYSGMELCMPIWLNHDYGDGGVVDIWVVDAYSRVEVCTPIFLGEVSNEFFSR